MMSTLLMIGCRLVSKESHYLHSVKKQQRKDILKQLKHEARYLLCTECCVVKCFHLK